MMKIIVKSTWAGGFYSSKEKWELFDIILNIVKYINIIIHHATS